MPDTYNMHDDELIPFHIDAFVDADGNPQQVDAIRWISSLPNVAAMDVSGIGMDAKAVAMKQGIDAAPKTTEVKLEVDEAGVKNAITWSCFVVVGAESSPPAVGVNVTVGAPQKQDPNAPRPTPQRKP